MNVFSYKEFLAAEHKDLDKARRYGIDDPEQVLFYADDVYIHHRDNEYELAIGTYTERRGTKQFITKKLYKYWLEEHTALFLDPQPDYYRGYETTQTGGGCTALYYELSAGYFIYLTDGDACIPSETDTEVILGLYDQNAETVFWVNCPVEHIQDVTKILVKWSDYILDCWR